MGVPIMALWAALAARMGFGPERALSNGQFAGCVVHHRLSGRGTGRRKRSLLKRRVPARCRR